MKLGRPSDRSATHLRPGIRPTALQLLALALAFCPLSSCWVTPPRTADLLAVGFRTPEQAFRTFQTAVRADEPALEFRCFSSAFTRRNHLSQRDYREGREQLRRQYPYLRKGLADAEISQPTQIRGNRAQLEITSHGRSFEIDLVREAFGEIWAGSELIADPEDLHFEDHTGIQSADDGNRWFYGHIPLPSDSAIDGTEITEIRVGREWKIDGFEALEPKTHPAARPE